MVRWAIFLTLADHIYLLSFYLLTNWTNLASNVVQNQNKIDDYIQ